jgi:Arc/MetJ-type ribon-helix-helix transcriptional regulator
MSGKALDDPNDRLLTSRVAKFMSQANNGKPKESRRGRPATGRDPVVAVRLPDETITEVDRLAKTLGLSSRSEAIRYMVTASIEPLEIQDERGPGLPTEIRSKERKCFQIDAFERERGKWRASIRRSDGSKVRVGNIHFDLFTTSVDTSTADQALQLARKAIDAGAVQ